MKKMKFCFTRRSGKHTNVALQSSTFLSSVDIWSMPKIILASSESRSATSNRVLMPLRKCEASLLIFRSIVITVIIYKYLSILRYQMAMTLRTVKFIFASRTPSRNFAIFFSIDLAFRRFLHRVYTRLKRRPPCSGRRPLQSVCISSIFLHSFVYQRKEV